MNLNGIALIAGVTAGVLLVAAGVHKLRSPETTAKATRALLPEIFGRLSSEYLAIAVRLLGCTEIALGVALMTGFSRPLPGALVVGLLTIFAPLMIRAIRRRVRGYCGCFGARSRIGRGALAMNLFVLALAAIGLVTYEGSFSISVFVAALWLIPVGVIAGTAILFAGLRIPHVQSSSPVSLRVMEQRSGTQAGARVNTTSGKVPLLPAARTSHPQSAASSRSRVDATPASERPRHPPRRRRPPPQQCNEAEATHSEVGRPAPQAATGNTAKGPFLSIERREGVPAAFRVREDVRTPPKLFFVEYGSLFGLGPHDRMVVVREGPISGDRHGYAHFVQEHKGYLLVGVEYTLTSLDGLTWAGLGRAEPGLDLPIIIDISEVVALATAREVIAARYQRLDPSSIQMTSSLVFTRSGLTGFPRGRYQLAHRCFASFDRGGPSYIVDVDARTGRVLNLLTDIVTAWVPAIVTGQSLYDGPVTASGEHDADVDQSRLRSTHVVTLNAQGSGELAVAIDYNTTGVTFAKAADQPGVTCQWAAEQTFSYLSTVFGISGVDGKGKGVTIYVDARDPETNAPLGTPTAFAATRQILLPADPGPKALPSLDVVAHEIGHCLLYALIGTSDMPGLLAQGESGALAESLSDILGVLVEFHATPATAEWTVFEDIFSPDQQRFLDKPWVSGDPGFYKGPFWLPANSVDQDAVVHADCGVPNRWFYLLCEGQTAVLAQPDVVGIGRPRAARILARMILTKKLQHTSQLADARAASDLAALELCGEFSQPHVSALQAWEVVKVTGFVPLPYTDPSVDDSDVRPWPAQLQWQVGQGETEWRVEVATDASFDTFMVLPSTTAQPGPPPVQVGVAEVLLQADTEYFWRVTATASPALEKVTRPVQRFKTDARQPYLKAPRDCDGDRLIHPWSCEFKWYPVDGAQSYQVQIARGKDFDDLLFGTETTGATSIIRDLPVNSDLWWRAKAIHDVTHEGMWSEPRVFRTDMPQVELVKPSSNSSNYPWRLQLEWKPVIGAVSYRVELTNDSNDGVELPQGYEALDFDVSDASVTTLMIDLPAGWPNDIQYDWQVRVFGPHPWDEEGDPSEVWNLFLDGKKTIPDMLTLEGTDTPDCLTIGQPVAFKWTSVDHAVGYSVRIRELIAPLNQPMAPGAIVYTDVVPPEPGAVQSLTLTAPASSPTSGAKDANGYGWEVVAVGPDALLGIDFAVGYYYLQPTTPVALVPDVTYSEDDQIIIGWTTSMAHGGGFVVEIYASDDCSGPHLLSDVITGFSPGDTVIEVEGLFIGQYSWRVRPFSYVGCGSSFNHWSSCAKLRIKKNVIAPTPTAECDQLIEWGETQAEVHHVDMHKTQGTFTFIYNAKTIKDRFVISYEGDTLWNQCVSATGSVALSFSGSTTVVTVTVLPNCDAEYQGLTEWNFQVSCQ